MTTLSLLKSLSLATAGTVAVVIVALKPVYAASVLLFNPATGGIGNSNNQSVGWQFDVNTPVKVTDLQWYDENADGLDVGHSVGIWNPEGTLLSSVFIPSGIALREHVRTLLESGIDTIAKALKFIPALPHPIFQHTPPWLNLVQVWRIGRQIPDLTSSFCNDFLNRL